MTVRVNSFQSTGGDVGINFRRLFNLEPAASSLRRRSVQSYIGINFFLLEKSRFYGAANSTFLGGSVRVK